MPTKRSSVIALTAAWLLLLCCTDKDDVSQNPISSTADSVNGVTGLNPGLVTANNGELTIGDLGGIARQQTQVDDAVKPSSDQTTDLVYNAIETTTGSITFDLSLDSGGVFTLPLDGFDDPGLVSARPASDEEAEEQLDLGGFDLMIPGIIDRSDIISRSDIITRSDLLALGQIDFGGQDAALSGKEIVFALPSSALPSNALPSSALPASALPASSIPSKIIPSNAIASTALPSSALPSSALPSNALPAQALPSSYYLVQAEEDLVVEAMAYFVGDDGSRGATRCDSAGDVSRSNVDGLHFGCKVEDDLPPGKVTLMVFATTLANYYEAMLGGLPVALCPRGLKVRPNTAPRITTNGIYPSPSRILPRFAPRLPQTV